MNTAAAVRYRLETSSINRIRRQRGELIDQLEQMDVRIEWAAKTELEAEALIQKAVYWDLTTNYPVDFEAAKSVVDAALGSGDLRFVNLLQDSAPSIEHGPPIIIGPTKAKALHTKLIEAMNAASKLSNPIVYINRKPQGLIMSLRGFGVKIEWAAKTELEAEELIQKATFLGSKRIWPENHEQINEEVNAAFDSGELRFVLYNQLVAE